MPSGLRPLGYRLVHGRRGHDRGLRRAVGSIGVGMDILVYSEEQAREWGEVENTVLHEALREGRLLAEA